MWRPASKWSWILIAIASFQTLIVLAFEAWIFVKFQTDLSDTSIENQARTIPTFLTLYCFGFLYQLVLVWDALRLKNTIQVIGLCFYNIGLLIYGAVQYEQIKEAVFTLNSRGELHLEVWTDSRPFLVAIPCILALTTVVMAFVAWKLYHEFAWTIYKHISADLRMKKRYLTYQVYISLLKFDFFFFLGFTVQFVVIVKNKTTVEEALTSAAIPVTIIILLMAAFFTKRENSAGMVVIIILYFGALAYFCFKLVRMYEPGFQDAYTAARKELTTFAVLTIILICCTIIIACLCMANFDKGLRPHIANQKLESDAEKNLALHEMDPNMAGMSHPAPARMTID